MEAGAAAWRRIWLWRRRSWPGRSRRRRWPGTRAALAPGSRRRRARLAVAGTEPPPLGTEARQHGKRWRGATTPLAGGPRPRLGVPDRTAAAVAGTRTRAEEQSPAPSGASDGWPGAATAALSSGLGGVRRAGSESEVAQCGDGADGGGSEVARRGHAAGGGAHGGRRWCVGGLPARIACPRRRCDGAVAGGGAGVTHAEEEARVPSWV